jgi:hypothetical protein
MILIALAFIVVPARAQEQRRHFTSRGTIELGGSISFMATQPVVNDRRGETIYTLSVFPYVGYFIIDGLELGLNPAGLDMTSSGSTTLTSLRILFAPSYNFRTPTIATPFVEGLAGLTSFTTSTTNIGTSTASGFTWGGRVGVKVAIVEKGLLNLAIQYLQVTANPSGVTVRNGSNQFSVFAGWTVWL